MSLWADRALPFLIEKAGRSHAILERRRQWVPRARGDVLEIGVGSGLNLAFYDPARVRRVVAIDPSRPLLARAAPRAAAASVPVELVDARAESLPFPDASFDSVVMTYTLCSIGEPLRALAEVRRVLRPDGELLFVEHGLADDERTRGWQRRLTPLWKRVAGNCHLDRDVPALLEQAGLVAGELDAAQSDGARWLSYTYQGAVRAGGRPPAR